MKSKREKQLEIALLTEKLQRISKKKVVFVEAKQTRKRVIKEEVSVSFQEALKTADFFTRDLIKYIYEGGKNAAKINELTLAAKKSYEESLEDDLSEWFDYSPQEIYNMFNTFCKIIKLYMDKKITLEGLYSVFENCYDNKEDAAYYDKLFKKSESAVIETLERHGKGISD